GCISIHLKFATERLPCATISVAEDSKITSVLSNAMPNDDKTTIRIGTDNCTSLVTSRILIYLKLASPRLARTGITLAQNPEIVAIRATTRPGHDKVSCCVGADRWR